MPKSRKSRNLDRWVRRNQGKHFCQCGCGQTIEVKRSHHKKSVGIPKYIKGHNLQQKTVEETAVPQKKSVWDRLSPEEQERRMGQLKNFGKGAENPAWKGGRRIDDAGYTQILMPDHPFAKDGYVPEHRLVVEERTRTQDPSSPLMVAVGEQKYLRSEAVVHHVDEDKSNNKSDNLMLLPNQAAHAFLHKSPLPMEERLRRIDTGVFHSGPLGPQEEDINADD